MGRLSAKRSFGASAVALGAAALVACAGGSPARESERPAPVPAVNPSGEVDCAWFGDEREGVLWFGVSAFWSAMNRAGGDPTADLASPGGRFLGHYDLERGVVGFHDAGRFPGGTWDVLAHPNGRVYFTTFFDPAGFLEAAGSGGRWTALGADTVGLNELALGPSGRIFATRYGFGDAQAGAVVVLGEDGRIQAELPLEAAPGHRVAAKSVAWDPVRGEIWVNTDLLPLQEGAPVAHDTRVLSPGGRELLRWQIPEVQFMVFGSDGTGYFAELDGDRLRLRIRPPEAAQSALGSGRWVALDDAFPADLDFVQEIRVSGDGRAVVTRWSGVVHVVTPEGTVRDLDLPRAEGDLFYTGVLHGDRLCATVCRTRPDPAPRAWVTCADLPD